MNSRSSPRGTLLGLALLAALLEGIFLALRRFHPFDQNPVEVMILGLAASGLYLVAAFLAFRSSRLPRATLGLVLVAALAFRATLLPLEPSLSLDLYRYQWEGQIQLAGSNPYLSTPHSLPLPGWERIPGPEVGAAYGPATELLFRFTAGWDGVLSFKLLSLVFDLAVLLVVIGLLRVSGQPSVRALLYGWCPLVVLEFAGSGHNDSLPLAALLAGNLLLITHRRVVSILALALATLSKWFAGVAAPLFFWRTPWWGIPLFLAAAAAFLLPYREAGAKLFTGLGTYAAEWRNNESLFGLLESATREPAIALGVAIGVGAGLAFHLGRRRAEPLGACLVLLAAVLLLSPSVFPWYVTWIVPFLCFYPHPALLAFTATVWLSYHVLIDYSALGIWRYQPWLVWLEYLPVYALLFASRSETGARAELQSSYRFGG